MARSIEPTPFHSRSRGVWQTSMTTILLSTKEYWRSLQSFPFTFLGTTLVFKRGQWLKKSRVLRRSASSCVDLVFCGGSLVRFGDSLRRSRERIKTDWRATLMKLKSTFARSICQFHSFCRRRLIAQSWICQCRRADGRRRMPMPRSTAAQQRPPLIVCSPLSKIVIWHLILSGFSFDFWHDQGLITMAFCSPTSCALSSTYEFWWPASFCWTFLMESVGQGNCISLRGSRRRSCLVSVHVGHAGTICFAMEVAP